MTSPVRGRPRRRWRWVALAVLLDRRRTDRGAAVAARNAGSAAPTGAEANKILAPSSVEFGAIRLSWFRPTEISSACSTTPRETGWSLAPRATFGWNLWQILVTRPKTATLTIEQRRRSTSSVSPTARSTFTRRSSRSSPSILPSGSSSASITAGCAFATRCSPIPVVADKADILLDLGRDYEPITWDIQLAQTQANGEPGRLDIEGNYSRADVDPSGQHDLTLSLKGTRWPWTLANSLIQARGELTGKLDGQIAAGTRAARRRCNHHQSGRDRRRPVVRHRSPRDRAAQLSLEGGDGSWTIDKLDVTSPIVSLQGQGSIPPTPRKGAWLEATVDLAAVARQLPATLHLRDDLRVERGQARLRADISLGCRRTHRRLECRRQGLRPGRAAGRENADALGAGDPDREAPT